MYNTSKGNYSVKLNKVIEKFNLKNLTPEVDTKKIVIRQTDVNRPALQFAGYFEYFDVQPHSADRQGRVFLSEDA